MKDANFYRTLETSDLERRYRSAEERSLRANSDAAWMTDAYAMQEIQTVLQERGIQF